MSLTDPQGFWMPWALDDAGREVIERDTRGVVGARLQRVRYVGLKPLKPWGHGDFDALDFGVELDFDGTGTWNATWETYNGLEGMALRPGSMLGGRVRLVDPDLVFVEDVTEQQGWRALVGTTINSVDVHWLDCAQMHEPDVLVPCIDALALRFSAGEVVVALGDADPADRTRLGPSADNLVVLFDFGRACELGAWGPV